MWDPVVSGLSGKSLLPRKTLLSSSSSLWRDLELKSRPGMFRDEMQMQRSGVLLRDQSGRGGSWLTSWTVFLPLVSLSTNLAFCSALARSEFCLPEARTGRGLQ